MKKALLLLGIFSITGCSHWSTQILIPQGEGRIVLQQPVTREIFVCGDEENSTAEDCAFYMEMEKGFVRLTDKSLFPGKDDIPQDGSYPTRRYRDNQTIPRW